MAHFDEIGEYSLDQVLTKRLTTPGGSVAPTVAPELFPTLVLENDRPEWGFIKGERAAASAYFVAAVAGQFSMLQMYLPSDARQLAVVRFMQVGNAGQLNLRRLVGIGGGAAGWVAATVATRDFRWNGERTSLIVESRQNAALPPSMFPAIYQFNGAGLIMSEPIIIAPGTALCVHATLVNSSVNVNVSWTERGAQPGELV